MKGFTQVVFKRRKQIRDHQRFAIPQHRKWFFPPRIPPPNYYKKGDEHRNPAPHSASTKKTLANNERATESEKRLFFKCY